MSLPATPAVRKNIVPLLGIAFVVAVLCTGLFYGVFASRFGVTHAASVPEHPVVVASHDLSRGLVLKAEDVRIDQLATGATPKGMLTKPDELAGRTLVVAAPEGTPILQSMLSTAAEDREIPVGMRALTLRPADSSSVLAVLQPGHRVDVQAWSDRGGEPHLRTILQNVEVLAVPRNGDAVVTAITLLVPAAHVDAVALADSAAHVRIALRSAADETSNGAGRNVAALFSDRAETAAPARAVAEPATLPDISVSVLGVTEAGLQRLRAVSGASAEHELRVRDLDAASGWEKTLNEAFASGQAVEISAAHAGAAHRSSVQFGNRSWLVRVRFAPAEDNRVRIEPEVITHAGAAVTVRKIHRSVQTALQAGGAAIVTGVCAGDLDGALLAKTAIHAGANVRDLVIVVRSHAPALTAALPRASH